MVTLRRSFVFFASVVATTHTAGLLALADVRASAARIALPELAEALPGIVNSASVQHVHVFLMCLSGVPTCPI